MREIYYMKRIDVADYYDDNNEGYIYGIHYFDEYTPEDLGQMMAVDCEWFKTEEEREIKINEEIKEYGFMDID